MARRGAAPRALLQVDLLGRLDVRTAARVRRDLRRPPRPGPVRPARPRPPAAVARGDRRRPVARIRRRPRPGRCARPCGSSATASPMPGVPAGLGARRRRRRRSASGPTRRIDLDVIAFEACLDATRLRRRARPSRSTAGDLVEGLGHDCFAAERERLADRYEDALAIVAERRLADGDLRGAQRGGASRCIARDPLREEAHADPDRGPRPGRHRARRSSASTAASRSSSRASSASRRSPRPTPPIGRRCATPSSARWSGPRGSNRTGVRPSWPSARSDPPAAPAAHFSYRA